MTTVSTQLVVRQPVVDRVPWGKNRFAASVVGKFDGGIVMTIFDTLTEPVALVELEPVDLRWRAEYMRGYVPLASWFELDLLLMQLGQPGFDYIVVERLAFTRFAQTMGPPEALIIEVCSNAGSPSPDVWRLRRAHGDRLPHAELGATAFDGGMDPDNLFTVAEAVMAFREWLSAGTVSGVSLDRVDY